MVGNVVTAQRAAKESGMPMSVLAAAPVRVSSQNGYIKAARGFLTTVRLAQLPKHLRKEALDAELEEFLDESYQLGLAVSAASILLSALRSMAPSPLRPLRVGLPLASASLAGWRKTELGKS